MQKRVCIVTGAAHGIGQAIASTLAQADWEIVALDVQTGCDVGKEADVKRAVEDSLERHGRIDALVNNAGRMGERKPLEELTLEDWNSVLVPNLTGMFLLARECAPALRKAKGAIVNIASTRAMMSEPNTFAYSASKGGIVALTHSLAASLAPDVRVNCISPGWIDVAGEKLKPEDKEQHWAGRVGRPEDISELVAFILSDKAGFITGSNLTVDGGMTRKMIYVE